MWYVNTNQAVQSQKMARDLKFLIYTEEELYYPCSENKGADQLRNYCEADLRLWFRICRLLVFSGGSFYGTSTLHFEVLTFEMCCEINTTTHESTQFSLGVLIQGTNVPLPAASGGNFVNTCTFILHLHYVPGGQGCHVSDNRDQNGINVRQRRGTGKANVARWDNHGHRGKFFDSLKICHGSHGRNEKRNGP